jgi:N-acyl-D-aspartate/D-glutamate deacylase
VADEGAGDLLVRGGTLIDGTGAPATGEPRDIRIRGGRIVEIGAGLRPDGEPELDATGATVTPGFIETHTHLDPTLFWDPWCDPMPQHGVTTVLVGNCSLSLAPARPDTRSDIAGVFSYVEDLPQDLLDEALDWRWSSVGELLGRLGAGGLGLNVATLVGHTPLRLWVMGADAWERPATDAESRLIAAALQDALAQGAFGLSSSLFDEDRRKRPVPSARADDAEMNGLLDVLARDGGIFQFIPHQSMAATEQDVAHMVELIGARPLTATWLGLFQSDKVADRVRAMLDDAAALQRAGVAIYPQISPRTIDFRANFFGGMSFMDLPAWHRMIQEPDAGAKRVLLEDAAWRDAARDEWDRVRRTMFPHRHPDKVRLVSVTRPELEGYVGKSLADLVAERGGHPSDVLADWVLANDLTPGVVGVGVSNDDPAGVAELLTHPAAVVSNSDAGAHLQMLCAQGDSTLLLTRHVRERADLTLADAVHQLTGRQAAVFGFAGRGVLAEGAAGDLAVFDLDELRWDVEAMVDDLPGGRRRLRRGPGGYRATVVAGRVTQCEGTLTGARPGTALGIADRATSRPLRPAATR